MVSLPQLYRSLICSFTYQSECDKYNVYLELIKFGLKFEEKKPLEYYLDNSPDIFNPWANYMREVDGSEKNVAYYKDVYDIFIEVILPELCATYMIDYHEIMDNEKQFRDEVIQLWKDNFE